MQKKASKAGGPSYSWAGGTGLLEESRGSATCIKCFLPEDSVGLGQGLWPAFGFGTILASSFPSFGPFLFQPATTLREKLHIYILLGGGNPDSRMAHRGACPREGSPKPLQPPSWSD